MFSVLFITKYFTKLFIVDMFNKKASNIKQICTHNYI